LICHIKQYNAYEFTEAHVFVRTAETLQLPAISRAYHEELRKLIFDADKMPPLVEVINAILLLQKPLQLFDKKYL